MSEGRPKEGRGGERKNSSRDGQQWGSPPAKIA